MLASLCVCVNENESVDRDAEMYKQRLLTKYSWNPSNKIQLLSSNGYNLSASH